MVMRRFLLIFAASLCLTSGVADQPTIAAADTGSQALLSLPSAGAIAQGMPRRVVNRLSRGMGVSPGLWLASLSVAAGALIALFWLHLYQQQRHWQRVQLARQEVKAFRQRPAVKKVLDILDYEEYRTFYLTHPEDGRLISFEANDARLRRALRSHDQMVKMRNGLDEIKRLATDATAVPAKTLALVEQYDQDEFWIEITLRDWFDSFLGGLEYFETLIESGLVRPDEIKPFIIYWVRLIGDRRYRRKGGSGFYDKLFHYIHWSGYGRVQSLFERYGFKLLPPPYSTHDFSDHTVDSSYDTQHALCLAKAAYLVYEDREYVADIARSWLSDDIDDRWQRLSNRQYVVEVIKAWLQEHEVIQAQDIERTIRHNFIYLDMMITNTQAFLFRKGDNLILVFKGTQQLADWKTNIKIRLRQFTLLADQTVMPPRGRVHRGFLDGWQSVEKQVVYYLRRWWTPETKLWVTGHSLGGALAAIATISLETQGFQVSGLYTFGQPRVADWRMVNAMNRCLGDRLFRYVNNNDIVPLIPPQIIPWVPTRVYGHMGQFRYFNESGGLRRQSVWGQRWPDRLWGLMRALITTGSPDAIDDHKMEFYVANLQKALDREEELARLEREKQLISGGDFMEEMRERRRRRRA